MTKRIPPQQRPFDWLETIPDVPTRRARPWYYITRNRSAEMLVDFTSDGEPIWVEHDLRVYLPHVYNCRGRAQQAATRLHGQVQMCHYDRFEKYWKPNE
jgi:hypothetical protein